MMLVKDRSSELRRRALPRHVWHYVVDGHALHVFRATHSRRRLDLPGWQGLRACYPQLDSASDAGHFRLRRWLRGRSHERHFRWRRNRTQSWTIGYRWPARTAVLPERVAMTTRVRECSEATIAILAGPAYARFAHGIGCCRSPRRRGGRGCIPRSRRSKITHLTFPRPEAAASFAEVQRSRVGWKRIRPDGLPD